MALHAFHDALKAELAKPACPATLSNCGKLLRSLKGEVALLPPGEKKSWVTLLQGYDARLDHMNRHALGLVTAASSKEVVNNGTLLQETGKLQRKTLEKLIHVKRLAAETRDLGQEAAHTLEKQKEQLVRTLDGVKQVNTELANVRRTLFLITSRMAGDKAILICMVLMFILVLVVIILVATKK